MTGAGGAIDIVVNNAGISIVKPALEMPEKDWDAVVDTNLRGAWLVAQTGGKRWVAARRPGVIVNIASILGLRTIGQVAPYNASKAGLIHLTRVLAMEWARHNIRVNAICPGYINTEMVQAVPKGVLEKSILPLIPIGRLGEPEEVARCVVFLASDDSGLITGSTLSANGGQIMV